MLPATLMHLIREPDTTAEDFSFAPADAARAATRWPSELEKEFHELTGQEIHEGYGMTELGIAANNPPTGLDKLGSIGLPNPGFVFSIRAEQGSERPDGREGRVFDHRAEPLMRLLERPQGHRRSV